MSPTQSEMLRRARQLRKNQTPEESVLWLRLRNRRLSGLKFYRQHPFGFYIVDFYCPQCRLVVELDGAGHLDQPEYDQQRTQDLNAQGITVMRFTNLEICQQLESVLSAILHACHKNRDQNIDPS